MYIILYIPKHRNNRERERSLRRERESPHSMYALVHTGSIVCTCIHISMRRRMYIYIHIYIYIYIERIYIYIYVYIISNVCTHLYSVPLDLNASSRFLSSPPPRPLCRSRGRGFRVGCCKPQMSTFSFLPLLYLSP